MIDKELETNDSYLNPNRMNQRLILNHKSINDKVYEYLKDTILDGVLKPGDRLNAKDLQAQLRVSRTPISHALHRLAGEYLVKTISRKGAFVARLSKQELEDLLDVILMLDRHAVKLCIERLTKRGAHLLKQKLERCAKLAKKGDHKSYRRCDFDLHWAIVKLTKNLKLRELYEGLNVQIHVAISAHVSRDAPRKLQDVQHEHEQIVEAILTKDVSAARRAVIHHISQTPVRWAISV